MRSALVVSLLIGLTAAPLLERPRAWAPLLALGDHEPVLPTAIAGIAGLSDLAAAVTYGLDIEPATRARPSLMAGR